MHNKCEICLENEGTIMATFIMYRPNIVLQKEAILCAECVAMTIVYQRENDGVIPVPEMPNGTWVEPVFRNKYRGAAILN